MNENVQKKKKQKDTRLSKTFEVIVREIHANGGFHKTLNRSRSYVVLCKLNRCYFFQDEDQCFHPLTLFLNPPDFYSHVILFYRLKISPSFLYSLVGMHQFL